MADAKYNIDAFNSTMNGLVQRLAATGNMTEELFMNLQDAYLSVPDKTFKDYIHQTLNLHMMGLKTISTNEFMHLAKAMYAQMVVNEHYLLDWAQRFLTFGRRLLCGATGYAFGTCGGGTRQFTRMAASPPGSCVSHMRWEGGRVLHYLIRVVSFVYSESEGL